jgi:mono/diheme cytochrome c family protein
MRQFAILIWFLAAGTVFSPVSAMAGGNPKEGQKIFDSTCNTCHGDKGTTDIPGIPVFAKGERLSKTDDQLSASIRTGVNNPNNPAGMTMPPYGGGSALNAKQVSDVIAYIRTLKK